MIGKPLLNLYLRKAFCIK